jgi:hypothetical protein
MLMPIDGKKPEGNGQEGSRQQGRSASRSRTFTQIRMLDSVASGVRRTFESGATADVQSLLGHRT